MNRDRNQINDFSELPVFASEADEAAFWATHRLGPAILARMGPPPPGLLPPPRTVTVYELWRTNSGNLAGAWDSDVAAQKAILRMAARHGRAYFQHMGLCSDRDGDPDVTHIAEGEAIVDWARAKVDARRAALATLTRTAAESEP